MHDYLATFRPNDQGSFRGDCMNPVFTSSQVGASTWATNIGAPMFVGIAGSAAASGIAVVMFEWHVRMPTSDGRATCSY